jgi:hypothetical protein
MNIIDAAKALRDSNIVKHSQYCRNLRLWLNKRTGEIEVIVRHKGRVTSEGPWYPTQRDIFLNDYEIDSEWNELPGGGE